MMAMDAYHGVTTAAMAATGMAPYWERFGPLAPGFLHAAAPNPYRLGDDDPQSCARLAIDSAVLAWRSTRSKRSSHARGPIRSPP